MAANYDKAEGEEVGDNSTNELIRYEFIEILCRVTKAKYIETERANNYQEGL